MGESELTQKVAEMLESQGLYEPLCKGAAYFAIRTVLEDMYETFAGEPAQITIKVYGRSVGIDLEQEGQDDVSDR